MVKLSRKSAFYPTFYAYRSNLILASGLAYERRAITDAQDHVPHGPQIDELADLERPNARERQRQATEFGHGRHR